MRLGSLTYTNQRRLCFYVNLTEDADKVFDVAGFAPWWERIQKLDSYKSTEPDLG